MTITLFSAFADFLLDLEGNGDVERTLSWYRVQLKAFLAEHGNRPLNEFTHDLIRGAVLDIQRSPQSKFTKRAKLNALHKLWSWASGKHGCPNFMASYKRPRLPDVKPKAIDADDLMAMFWASYKSNHRLAFRDRALLIFMADTGVRTSGARTLKLIDLDMKRRRATVEEKGRVRSVSFTHLTAQYLTQWLAKRSHKATYVFTTVHGDQLGESAIRQIFNRLAKKAGVERRHHPHAFRHFAGREFLKQGGDLASAAQSLGHSSVSTTAKYYTVFNEDELAADHDEHSPLKSLFKRRETI